MCVYRNEGVGIFADVTTAAAVGDVGWGTHAAFVDYDRDGDLDLYAANYMEFDPAHNEECFAGMVRIYCGPNTYPRASWCALPQRLDDSTELAEV